MLQTDTIAQTGDKLGKVATNVENVTTTAVESTAQTVQESLNMISQLQQKGLNLLLDFGPKIIVAILLLWLGFKLTNFLSRRIYKIMVRRNVEASLVPFITQVTSIVLKILIVITVISIVGIEMTSFIALLGAMGLAIGMAFSGTLSNVAGGVVLLVLKTFKVGDYISAQGIEGTVKSIQIFTTVLITPDNKTISIPNGPLSTGTITNYSLMETRRLDINIKLAHGTETTKIAQDIIDILKQDERILRDPQPNVLTNITDSSVTLDARFWTANSDYWPVNASINEKIYQYLYQNNITVPLNRISVPNNL
ncbi:MAG: mechanosensitive ion channel [Bacteroidales bacterium]|nr:mechanosensitive ion channel [Bacteroidales bacterium]